MDTKYQIAAGLTTVLAGSLLLWYVSRPSKRTRRRPPLSKVEELVSSFKPRPDPDDIRRDNQYRSDRTVESRVSDGGVVYHDIRYNGVQDTPESETTPTPPVETTPTPSAAEPTPTITPSPTPESAAPESAAPESAVPESAALESAAPPPVEISASSITPVAAVEESASPEVTAPQPKELDEKVEAGESDPSCAECPAENGISSAVTNGAAAVASPARCPPPLISSDVEKREPATNSTPAKTYGGLTRAAGDDSLYLTPDQSFSESGATPSNGSANPGTTPQRSSIYASQEIIQQLFNIPSKAVGKIIGKGGRSIKGIQYDSGAKLKFESTRDNSKPFQRLFVSGTLRQVEDAVSRLAGLMPADCVALDIINWSPEKAVSGVLTPIELRENETITGRVTHVLSPESIWVQVGLSASNYDYVTGLATLTDNLTETLGRKLYDLKNSLIPATEVKRGTHCAVMVEGRAYRGCVEEVGEGVHSVRLVDFGTLHSIDHLFQLHTYYQTLPALAVHCSLAHVSLLPEDRVWPEEAARYLEENLRSCLLRVRVVAGSTGKPSVELYTGPNKDSKSQMYVNRQLVYERYAAWSPQE